MSNLAEGIGAVVTGNGVTFRVWAPFAEKVAVMGDFNDWSKTATLLTKDDGGYWAAHVSHAKVGQEYKYVITNNDQELLRNDPRALQLTPSGDNSVIVSEDFHWGDDNFSIALREDLIIYEMHIGTFCREDETTPGTFKTATTKLEHLKNLGVNAIELMPCSESKSDLWWGYTPDYIYAVEAAYGGRKAFKEFVKAAHAHGIAVILDVVYNHLSSREDLDMWRFDGWYENNMGGIYFYNDWRGKTPWGDTRFDYGRPDVRQYILDNAKMWVRDCHVDGLRVDATVFMRRTDFETRGGEDIGDGWRVLCELNNEIDQLKPSTLIIAEDLQGNHDITKPTKDGGAGFSAQWDAWLGAVVREAMHPLDDKDRDIQKIADAITAKNFNGNIWQRVIYTESHDSDANGGTRIVEEIAPGNASSIFARKRSALGAAILFTAPGIPMLFQGQEFLEDGAFNHWDALDWNKAEKYHGILQLYADLIHLRHNASGTTRGLQGENIIILLIDTTANILAYHRFKNGGAKDDVVVITNFSNTTQTIKIRLPREGLWKTRFNSDWQGYSDDFTNAPTPDIAMNAKAESVEINIAPYSAIIMSQDE